MKNMYREKLLDTFYAFDSFCKRNDIKYFAAYGTLIGAVRHHGLIPWDDDIDVWMLPDDYERIMSFKGKIDDHYDIINDSDENYWLYSLIKFVDTNTTLWESEEFPCITGVYIDIFPLIESDEMDAVANRAEYDTVSSKLTNSLRHYSLGKAFRLFLMGQISEGKEILWNILYSKFVYKRNRSKYDELVARLKNSKGSVYVSYDGPYREKEIFPKNWFNDINTLNFEKIQIPVPRAYDAILKQLYGDYMQLPPKNKRVSHHSLYYLDLNQRWNIRDIQRIKRNKV